MLSVFSEPAFIENPHYYSARRDTVAVDGLTNILISDTRLLTPVSLRSGESEVLPDKPLKAGIIVRLPAIDSGHIAVA
jgi:hypothetical protein